MEVAARQHRVSRNTIRRVLREGTVPGVKDGQGVWIDPIALRRVMATRPARERIRR